MSDIIITQTSKNTDALSLKTQLEIIYNHQKKQKNVFLLEFKYFEIFLECFRKKKKIQTKH